MSILDRIGCAYHEAGHAVVAWALGLEVDRIRIGIGGDDAKGACDIGHFGPGHSLEDRIAVFAAGVEAQILFEAATHDLAGWGDNGGIIELLDDLDEEKGNAVRQSGHLRALELLRVHSNRVHRVANALIASGDLDRSTLDVLLA